MADQQLYTLDDIGQVKPVTWAEYDLWEQSLDPNERCPLGKKIKVDVMGSATVTSLFCLVPMGYFGHKPQLFLTLAVGAGVWLTSVYTSHRACLSGHRDIVSKVRKRISEQNVVHVPSTHHIEKDCCLPGIVS